MKIIRLYLVAMLFCTVSAACHSEKGDPWRALFNGSNLNGWDTYLGPKYNPEKKDFDGNPIGLNNDPDEVFSVVAQDGGPVIRISGEHFGGISTAEEYENYHLTLQFKWGEDKYAPRQAAKRDSGILYHAVGPHAKEWFFWMRSQEMQVQEGDCGDFWSLDGSMVDIRAAKNENDEYVYSKSAPSLTFHRDLEQGGHVVKADNGNSEKPNGEWNTLELYTVGGTSVHVVNGVVKMILTNSRQIVEGTEVPLHKGKIQIQSEGAEVFYRNIKIKSITKIPEEILNQ